jgi:hypothetical protein
MEDPMTHASRSSFLRRFGRGAASQRASDLADMGTAFALDEALERGDCDTLVPGEPARPMRAVVPVAPWRLWLGRKLG